MGDWNTSMTTTSSLLLRNAESSRMSGREVQSTVKAYRKVPLSKFVGTVKASWKLGT